MKSHWKENENSEKSTVTQPHRLMKKIPSKNPKKTQGQNMTALLQAI
jgi:hypothetical protein